MPKKYIVILDYYDDWDKFLVVPDAEDDLSILNNKDEQELNEYEEALYNNYIGNVAFNNLLDEFPIDTLREDVAVIRIYI